MTAPSDAAERSPEQPAPDGRKATVEDSGLQHPADWAASSLATSSGNAGDHLVELVSLLLSTASVDTYLDDLARVAAQTMPTILGCGITLRRGEQPLTVASSDALAAALDEIQYGKGEGPCLQAMHTVTAVSVPDMSQERRWGDYPAHAVAHGVNSSLSVPLVADGKRIGAMNIYAATAGAFKPSAVMTTATSLAAQASSLLTVLIRQAHQVQLSASLRETLGSRAVIDQAMGILMVQQRCTAASAFAILRGASQHRNRKLRDIAVDVITSATGHAPQDPVFTDPPQGCHPRARLAMWAAEATRQGSKAS